MCRSSLSQPQGVPLALFRMPAALSLYLGRLGVPRSAFWVLFKVGRRFTSKCCRSTAPAHKITPLGTLPAFPRIPQKWGRGGNCRSNPPFTRTGGQDDSSLTNSLKQIAYGGLNVGGVCQCIVLVYKKQLACTILLSSLITGSGGYCNLLRDIKQRALSISRLRHPHQACYW